MPELLKKSYRDELVTWIGRTCRFRLLYKISRDGCSAQTFHQKCDGQGPTVTILYNTNNTIFGGYFSESWNSNGSYIVDESAFLAFLFRLQYNGSSNPLKFPVNDSTCAGYGHNDYGPTFGGRYNRDIQAFTKTVTNLGNYSLNGSINSLGTTYNLNGQDKNSITNNNLQVTDLEVYKVEAYEVGLQRPWREHTDWKEEKMNEIKEKLVTYKPSARANVETSNILLLGEIGAGKSSFFNSLNSAFRGKLTCNACCGGFGHSATTMFRKYKIQDKSSGENLSFRLCDTRGFEEEFTQDPQELVCLLDGSIPDCYPFNPTIPFTADFPGYVKDPDLGDKIHCVAFVIDGSTVDLMQDKVYKQIKDIRIKLNHRGLPQIVVLTKLDKICSNVNDDVTNTFTSSAVRDAVNKVANITGLPRSHVLPVKNYENETKLKTEINILLFYALRKCLDFADDFIDEQIDNLPQEKKKNSS
ncbi:interferon-induced protein 44-like [Crassostrea virginica]